MLREKMDNDFKEALKGKDALKVSTLRLLKAAIKNMEIEKKGELKDDDITVVIKKQAKQRKESIEEFKKANRNKLAEKEEKELEILKAYLPEEISPEKLFEIVKEAIAALGASSPKDIGMVIKEVMAKTKGACDGKLVSAMAKDELLKKQKRDGGESNNEEA